MARCLQMATPTLRQLTTAATMDMSWMVLTPGSVSTMDNGTEVLQVAAQSRVSGAIIASCKKHFPNENLTIHSSSY